MVSFTSGSICYFWGTMIFNARLIYVKGIDARERRLLKNADFDFKTPVKIVGQGDPTETLTETEGYRVDVLQGTTLKPEACLAYPMSLLSRFLSFSFFSFLFSKNLTLSSTRIVSAISKVHLTSLYRFSTIFQSSLREVTTKRRNMYLFVKYKFYYFLLASATLFQCIQNNN